MRTLRPVDPFGGADILFTSLRVALATLIAIVVVLVPATAQARTTTIAKKSPARYLATGEACQPVKALTTSDQPSTGQVGAALPAPPAGQDWRITFGVNGTGFVVRIFLGDVQVGSGLVRWDRSYRVTLFLNDFEVGKDRIDVSGRIEGCDILRPEPSRIGGSFTGPLQLAGGVAITKGDLLWDQDGIRLSGDALIACPKGGTLGGSAKVTYTGAGDWTMAILGSSPGTCTLGPIEDLIEKLQLKDATLGGTITAKAGNVSGRLTGGAGVVVSALPGTWTAAFTIDLSGTTSAIVLNFVADLSGPLGFAKVTIGPDGKLVVTANLTGLPAAPTTSAAASTYVDPVTKAPVAAPTCVVPFLARGSTLTTARRKLTRANCGVRVVRVKSAKVKKGRVVGTFVRSGRTLSAGAKVTVRVSKGPGPTRRG